MGCLPISGGCERKLTDPFVMYLNQIEETTYVHVRNADEFTRFRREVPLAQEDDVLFV